MTAQIFTAAHVALRAQYLRLRQSEAKQEWQGTHEAEEDTFVRNGFQRT
jgi:hypothetical protein